MTGARAFLQRYRQNAVIGLCLVLLVAAAFGQTVTFGFAAIDDVRYVTENEHVLRGLGWDGLRWAMTAFHAGNWHPLAWLSHMFDVSIHGDAPGGHHLTNVVLHGANALLLYAGLAGLTGFRWPSALAAALFAVHPLRAESVVWIAERKDVLSGFFWFLALVLYLRYARRPGAGRYLAVLAAFLLGLMAKSVLVTLPLVLLLLDWWPLGRLRASGQGGPSTPLRWGPLLLEKAPFFAGAIAVGFLTYRSQAATGAIDAIPLASRLSNVVVSYALYLGKTVWPAGLAVFYPHPFETPPARVLVPAAALLLAISAIAIATIRRQPWLAVGWVWFAVTLVPMAGVIQVGGQAMADRYTYVPGVGLSLAVSWMAAAFARASPAGRRVVMVTAPAACGALLVAAVFQAGLWSDDVRLMEHALRVAPGNWLAHGTLATVFFERGDAKGAEEQLRLALAANPTYFNAHANYAVLLASQGRYAAAYAHAQRAMEINPEGGRAFGLPALIQRLRSRGSPP